MGFVHLGRLDREFEDAVFAAPVGRVQLARGLHGFQVFEVLERQPSVQLTFEQARPIIARRGSRGSAGLKAFAPGEPACWLAPTSRFATPNCAARNRPTSRTSTAFLAWARARVLRDPLDEEHPEPHVALDWGFAGPPARSAAD